MPKGEGFEVMDVSTRVHRDAKFRALARAHPDLYAPAFLAYMATMAESWAEGTRLGVVEAWPPMLPYQEAVVTALHEHRLVDRDGRIASGAWDGWFGNADRRREVARERWRRANHNRASTALSPDATGDVTARSPRENRQGNSGDPYRTVPYRTLDTPSPHQGGGKSKTRANGENPRATGENPRATGDSPRATGDSPRQERDREKRGPTALGDIIRQASDTPKEVPEW